MARIDLVVPHLEPKRSGNAVTAQRYRKHLIDLGHDAHLGRIYRAPPAKLIIGLNAYRSHLILKQWRALNSAGKVVVVLTGTDVYRFMETHRAAVLECLHRADRLVGLNDRIGDALPSDIAAKLVVLHEAAEPIQRNPAERAVFGRHVADFQVIVVGHLRVEKDPLRAAHAVHGIADTSRIRVHHYGAAYDHEWADRARQESSDNSRYDWHGEVSRETMRRVFAAADVMVVSSILEGGANVVSEAIMADLPILATEIPGNVGVLGPDYQGYVPVRDAEALQEALLRCEQSPEFLQALRGQLASLKPKLSLDRERQCLSVLLAELNL